MEAGEGMLSDILEAAEQNENTDIFLIKIHPDLKKGYITSSSDVVATLPVRVVDLNADYASVSGISPDSSGMVPYNTHYLLKEALGGVNKVLESNKALEARMALLEIPEAKEVDTFDRIGAILEKPGVTDIIGKLLDKLQLFGQPKQNIVVAGINDNVKDLEKTNSASIPATNTDTTLNAPIALQFEAANDTDFTDERKRYNE